MDRKNTYLDDIGRNSQLINLIYNEFLAAQSTSNIKRWKRKWATKESIFNCVSPYVDIDNENYIF